MIRMGTRLNRGCKGTAIRSRTRPPRALLGEERGAYWTGLLTMEERRAS
jgi:hypothetical protein